jgi:hypothetical protein
MPNQDTVALFRDFRCPTEYPSTFAAMSHPNFDDEVRGGLLQEGSPEFHSDDPIRCRLTSLKTSLSYAHLPFRQRVKPVADLREFSHSWILGTAEGEKLASSGVAESDKRKRFAELLSLWRGEIRRDYAAQLATQAPLWTAVPG